MGPTGGCANPPTRTVTRWVVAWAGCPPCLLSGRAQQNSPSAGPPPTLPRNNSPSMGLPAAYPRKSSPNTGPPPGHPRKSSPNTGPPPGHPRKSSPSAPENSVFRPFWACRANFFALTHTSSRAGRTFSRTGHSHVATLKPMTPLQPLTRASMKPPSPLLTPDQQPLKPTTPPQPKNAPKTPISHPQRRRRFQESGPPGQQDPDAIPMAGGRARLQCRGRQGLAGRPVGGRRYKRRQTNTIQIASRGPLLQTSSI